MSDENMKMPKFSEIEYVRLDYGQPERRYVRQVELDRDVRLKEVIGAGELD